MMLEEDVLPGCKRCGNMVQDGEKFMKRIFPPTENAKQRGTPQTSSRKIEKL